jgi:hypothetical protein
VSKKRKGVQEKGTKRKKKERVTKVKETQEK